MFDLENEIKEWRKEMMRAGITHEEKLAELESHLREQVAASIRFGRDEEAAFRTALSQLGSPKSVQREFNKLNGVFSTKAIVAMSFGALFTMAVSLFVLRPAMVTNPLLMGHVICLTTGYLTALICGVLGIYHVLAHWLASFRSGLEDTLCRLVVALQWAGVGLVGMGLLLGMLWKINGGNSSGGGLREKGTLGVFVWLVGMILIQKRRARSPHQILMLQIISNILVIVAWFGAGIATSNASSYGLQSYWWFELLLAGHLIAFLCGLIPGRSMDAKKC